MAILTDTKAVLRISNTAYDTEITDLIAACKADLAMSGILVTDDTDTLAKRAIMTYCKANFGFDNPDSDKLQQAYYMLKQHMALSADYAYYTVTITASAQGQVIFDGETKETNDSGVVVFYSRAKNHVEYTVDGTTSYVDITANTVIGGEE